MEQQLTSQVEADAEISLTGEAEEQLPQTGMHQTLRPLWCRCTGGPGQGGVLLASNACLRLYRHCQILHMTSALETLIAVLQHLGRC